RRTRKPSQQRLAVPAGAAASVSCPAGLNWVPLGLPLPLGQSERKCAGRPCPLRPPGGSALRPPLPASPRGSVRRVPERSRVTWPRAGGGSEPGAGPRQPGRWGGPGAGRGAAAGWPGPPGAPPLPHARGMPGCPCPCGGMAGQRLLFLTALALELLGGAGGSQQALRSRAAATACRLDNKESESWGSLLSGERLDTWICSLLGSLMVGLSGVFPLLIIPLEMGTTLRSEAGARRLKQLLSFALGGLLGNVFLHLLPEAWAYTCSTSPGPIPDGPPPVALAWHGPSVLPPAGGEGQSLQQQQQLGLWVIAGFLTFLALEKMLLDSKEEGGTSQAPSKDPAAAAVLNGSHYLAQPAAEPSVSAVVRSIKVSGPLRAPSSYSQRPPSGKPSSALPFQLSLAFCPFTQVSGYLNLLANTIDNFTHGLAVAASFLVSKKIGLLTTMAILLHEIPHEVSTVGVGDFAILLRAGFDRWSAAKLQLSTALGGLLGACFAICTQSPEGVAGTPPNLAEETVAWILPFTSGGFLYIALVNVLPDLLEEDDPWRSLQQVLLLCAGIVAMVLFSLSVE
ncbi:hypothetical protein MC885_015433, partial [Smutsia gigantea]